MRIAADTRTEITVEEILSGADPAIALRTVFQPIVDLSSGRPVGYEALTRGPVGTNLEFPDRLFAAAEEEGLVIELDHLCQATALETALATPALAGSLTFINAEPLAFTVRRPPRLAAAWVEALVRLRPVVEISERRVLDNPAALLQARQQFKNEGVLIAVDDVGVNPESLALLPLIEPDIVKLDMVFVQHRFTPERAGVLNAVIDYQERSGALLVMEGVEDLEQVDRANGFGADLGQGYHWGRPGAPEDIGAVDADRRLVQPVAGMADLKRDMTPYDAVARNRHVRVAKRDIVLGISRDLEDQAIRSGDGPLVFACFQDYDRFSPATRAKYERIAESACLVAGFGIGFPAAPVPGMVGVNLRPYDALALEWIVLVLSPHMSAALLAMENPIPNGSADGPSYLYTVTYDRDLVSMAARILTGRIGTSRSFR